MSNAGKRKASDTERWETNKQIENTTCRKQTIYEREENI